MASSLLSPFCSPEEDPFLLLHSTLCCIERILQCAAGKPLQRIWIDQPYSEEEITLLEDEVLPAIQQCLQRIDAIDQVLLEEQDARIALAQLDAQREAEQLLAGADQPGGELSLSCSGHCGTVGRCPCVRGTPRSGSCGQGAAGGRKRSGGQGPAFVVGWLAGMVNAAWACPGAGLPARTDVTCS